MVQLLTSPSGIENLCPPGLKQSSSHGYGEGPQSLQQKIIRNAPTLIDGTPLYALSAMVKKDGMIRSTEFSWHEKKHAQGKLQLCTGYEGADNGVPGVLKVKGDLWMIHQNQLLMNMVTNEIMLVACTPQGFRNNDPEATIDLQVIRGYSDSAAKPFALGTAIGCATNDCMIMIGTAFEEKSCNPDSIRRDPVQLGNITQIFRKGYCLTGTAKEIDYQTGDPVAEMKAEALHAMSQEMERAMLFGQMWRGQRNGKEVRTMDGILSMIRRYAPDNYRIRNPNSPLGLRELEEHFADLFKFGSQMRCAYIGRRAALNIQRLVRANTEFQLEAAMINNQQRVMKWTTIFGTLLLKIHPDFCFMGEPWNSSIVIIDQDTFMKKPLRNRQLKHYNFSKLDATGSGTCAGDVGMDGYDYGWLAEYTIALKNPENSMVIQNICDVGKDCYECVIPAPFQTCPLPTPRLPCPPARVDCDRTEPVACQKCGCPTECGDCSGCGDGGGDCAPAVINELPDSKADCAFVGIPFEPLPEMEDYAEEDATMAVEDESVLAVEDEPVLDLGLGTVDLDGPANAETPELV